MKLRHAIQIAAAVIVAVAAGVVAGSAGAGSANPAQLAYSSLWDGQADIYTMALDGTAQLNLTHDKTQGVRSDSEPAWSPDGSLVAFERDFSHGGSNLMVVNADRTGLRQLTASPFPGVMNSHPSWTPDGSLVAFTSNRDGNFDLFAVKAGGLGQQQLTFTNAPIQNLDPQWSPDGRWVVFSRTLVKGGPAAIYKLKLSSGAIVRLTSTLTGVGDVDPMWSPDGTRIAFSSDRGGSNDIFVINADGTALTALTRKTSDDNHPTWSPNGKALAFVSDRTRATEIFTIALGTGTLSQLTFDGAFKTNPTWRRAPVPMP